jgi:hypothetical protein
LQLTLLCDCQLFCSCESSIRKAPFGAWQFTATDMAATL